MKKVLKILCSFAVASLFVSQLSHARELQDMTLKVPVTKKGAEAKQEAFDLAIEDATRRTAEDMVGADKVAKSWDSLKSKILKNSTKYVVFIKGSSPQESKQGTFVEVQMRLSPDHLESALRESGLFGSETVRVLPLVQIAESQGSRYIWWADLNDAKAPANLSQTYFNKFFQQLAGKFKGKNIFVLDPTSASFRMSLPATYRTESIRREDQGSLGQYLKADVILSGRVDVVRLRSDSPEHKVEYALELWQVKTGRTLAEANEQETVGSDNAKVIQGAMDQIQPRLFTSLADKLNEAVAGGNLNLSSVRIVVEGSLNPRQLMAFKKLLASVREIRLLRERLIEPYRTTFEGESTVRGGELAKSIEKARFPQYKVDVSSAQDDRLVLHVKATGPASVQ